MICLLDTDTATLMMRGLSIKLPRSDKHLLRHEIGKRILNACRLHAADGDVIGLSAITVAELEFGVCSADEPSAERARMKHILAPFVKFDFGSEGPAHHYGEVRSSLEAKGQGIGPNELLIAAHALALSAVLVTNNIKEFKRVRGLRCENWAL